MLHHYSNSQNNYIAHSKAQYGDESLNLVELKYPTNQKEQARKE